MSIEGKVAVITGGGTGIGLGIARVLVSRGAKLAILQRSRAHLEQAARELSDFAVLTAPVDISDRDAVERAMLLVEERFGGIDILVNNASLTGMPAVASFLECSPEQMNAIIDINLKGTFHCSQIAARQMVAQGRGGSIVHVSSVGAYAAQESASVYCATKAAQVSLAQSMALELALYGIRVNALAPGDIRTEASAEIVSDLRGGGATGRYVRLTPLGRRGTPEEVGQAVAFLISEEAAFITGATLLVDGGFLAY
jgi:NAD(P)-dependent dehydrogenase (short-subunit alcohol dehydrogenase family)